MVIKTSANDFISDSTLAYIDESMSIRADGWKGFVNVDEASEELALAVNALCAKGVELGTVKALCETIRKTISLIEEVAYSQGVTAYAEGRTAVDVQIINCVGQLYH